jgi:hypothetical protein
MSHAKPALLLSVLTTLLSLPAVAHATFPGQNGKIAFNGIYTLNADGTGRNDLTPGGSPAWSPDGNQIAFVTNRDGNNEIYAMNADGTAQQRLTSNPASDVAPAWSPDGDRIVFGTNRDGNAELYVMNADGSGPTRITDTPQQEFDPEWSPNGRRIAFNSSSGGFLEIYTIRPDGSDRTFVVRGEGPRWAPNGHELWSWDTYYDEFYEDYFNFFQWVNLETGDSSGGPYCCSQALEPVVSPDGTKLLYSDFGETFVEDMNGGNTRSLSHDAGYDWQPLPVDAPSSFARPASANRVQFSLVPAYEECWFGANREHGPPLAYRSCAPPQPGSSRLTVGVGDGDPAPSRSTGFVRLKMFPGTPGGVDDTTARVRLNLTNVMRSSDLSDYTGELRGSVRVRITDREGVSGSPSQTVQDFPLAWTIPCTATASTSDGATCDLGTDLDALVPGATPERTRAIWALDQVKVYEGGPDEDADTPAGDSLFAVQGVFVP